ncbi:MAG TPA: isoprenylcysteine carboxylmethyltransferase family protein [Opitutaceae bacterium]|nr:isoprenylcysteine carboxylmethyltransferase family protein [Opitutaceae bacterium]
MVVAEMSDAGSQPSRDHPGVIAFPPLLFAGGALLSGSLHFIWPLRLSGHRWLSLAAGILLAAGAATLAKWAERTMKAAGTNVRPDRPALTVVRTGPYRFTRNPMYLALCLLQLALGFALNDWISLLAVIPLALILHFGVVRREEKYLEMKFGEHYLALKRDVRRWL